MKQVGSQNAAILSALQRGRALTHLEALREFNVARLAARVCELKALGHAIQSEIIELPSGKRIARYWMVAPRAKPKPTLTHVSQLGLFEMAQ